MASLKTSWSFVQVPTSVFESELSSAARLVFCVLCTFADRKTDTCFPSVASIGKKAGMSERTVQRILPEIEAAGWVKREERFDETGQRKSDVYTLVDLSGGDKLAEGGCQNVTRGGVKMSPELYSLEREPINNTNIAQAKPSRKVSPKAESSPSTPSPIAEVEEAYFTEYKAIYSADPLYSFPKNRAMIKRRLAGGLTVAQLRKVIHLASKDQWIRDNGFQLSTILSDAILGRLKDLRDPWGVPEIRPEEPTPTDIASPEKVAATLGAFRERMKNREP